MTSPGVASTVQGPSSLAALTIAPGVAPWVGARVGIAASNEGGITYTGRSLRVDGRHAFSLGAPTLSVGLGASFISARRPGDGSDGGTVLGGGADIPVLLGFRSKSDLYAIWFGPRIGFDVVSGAIGPHPETMVDVSGRHFYGGLTAGMRVGFRHFYGALEVNAAYHRADATFNGTSTDVQQFTLTPAAALEAVF